MSVGMHMRAARGADPPVRRRRVPRRGVGLPATLAAYMLTSSSHVLAHADSQPLATTQLEGAVFACLTIALGLYAIGLARVWRSAGVGSGIRAREAICLACGFGVLACSMFGPLERLAAASFAAHMVQHELLMVVAAPLIALGRPLGAWSWAFPLPARRSIGRVLRAPWFARTWRLLTLPLTAWCLHAIALWVWHAPMLFRAAAASEPLHALQHASFFVTALLFWWAVLARGGARPGMAFFLLFTTMVHSGALGALLSFSTSDWYALDGAPGRLAQQQLGGLIMWVPGGAVYLAAGLALAHRLLTTSDEHVQTSGA
jgi:putative membrane protein